MNIDNLNDLLMYLISKNNYFRSNNMFKVKK